MAKNFDYYRSVYPLVALLASDKETQIRSVPPFVRFAEDAVDNAELVFLTALGSVGRATMSQDELAVVAELLKIIEDVAGREGPTSAFWEDDALSGPEWETIRRAARRALDRLNALRGPPD